METCCKTNVFTVTWIWSVFISNPLILVFWIKICQTDLDGKQNEDHQIQITDVQEVQVLSELIDVSFCIFTVLNFTLILLLVLLNLFCKAANK